MPPTVEVVRDLTGLAREKASMLKGMRQRAKAKRLQVARDTKKRRLAVQMFGRKALLARYGLTYESFYALLDAQGGKCGICRSDAWPGVGPCVDHCHRTGKVRGILCSRCNTGLGCYDDNLDHLNAAIVYLERSRS